MTQIVYPPPPAHEQLAHEYDQLNANFCELMEIRFKLLGLTPTLGGVAVFALSYGAFGGLAPAGNGVEAAALVLAAAAFGFLAVLGTVIYDQRNSELYNALVHRATYLEEFFGSPNSPGALRQRRWGGQFQQRPAPERRLFGRLAVSHDRALALIYSPVLGAWFFPAGVAVGRLPSLRSDVAALIAPLLAALATANFLRDLIRQGQQDHDRWVRTGQGL